MAVIPSLRLNSEKALDGSVSADSTGRQLFPTRVAFGDDGRCSGEQPECRLAVSVFPLTGSGC